MGNISHPMGNGPCEKIVVIPPGPRLSPHRKQKAQPINEPNMKYVAQPPWFNLDHIWWAPRGKFIYVDHPIARHPHEAKRSALHPKQVPFRGRAYKKIEKNKKNGIEVWRPRNLCENWNFLKGLNAQRTCLIIGFDQEGLRMGIE